MSLNGPDAEFRAALAQGRIQIQRCTDCSKHVFFPRVICPHCHGASLEWVEASGEGVVYSTTVVRTKPERGDDYNVALIDLAEGVRMMSRVEGISPGDVAIGMQVRGFVGEVDGRPGLLFKPVGTV